MAIDMSMATHNMMFLKDTGNIYEDKLIVESMETTCPYCNESIEVNIHDSYILTDSHTYNPNIRFTCPHCKKSFISMCIADIRTKRNEYGEEECFFCVSTMKHNVQEISVIKVFEDIGYSIEISKTLKPIEELTTALNKVKNTVWMYYDNDIIEIYRQLKSFANDYDDIYYIYIKDNVSGEYAYVRSISGFNNVAEVLVNILSSVEPFSSYIVDNVYQSLIVKLYSHVKLAIKKLRKNSICNYINGCFNEITFNRGYYLYEGINDYQKSLMYGLVRECNIFSEVFMPDMLSEMVV